MQSQAKVHGGLTVTTKADHMDQFRSEMLTINALSYLAVLHIKAGEVSAKRKGRRKSILERTFVQNFPISCGIILMCPFFTSRQ